MISKLLFEVITKMELRIENFKWPQPQQRGRRRRSPLLMHVFALILLSLLCQHQSNFINCSREHQQQHPQKASSQCPQQWFKHGQKCYKITYTPRNYENAKSRCNDLKSNLAYVEDEDSKDEEPATNGSLNNSIIHHLIENKKAEIRSRMYLVNVSPELQKQNKIRYQNENNSMNPSDSYEHQDLDLSDLWLPHGDPEIDAQRLNASNIQTDHARFALAYSSQFDRWGLVPISPSKRSSFICEKGLATNSETQHHSQAHPIAGTHHHQNHYQNVEPNRARDSTSDLTSSPSAPNSHHSSTANPEQHSKRMLDKEVTSTTTPLPDTSNSALFRDFPQNQAIVLGSTSEMRCSAIEHDSTLNWTFNGKNLTQTNRVRIQQNGILRIEHVRTSDGGNYTCTIQSGSLVESKTAKLEIIYRPHQPEYINATLLDQLSTSVRVEWTPGFNGNSPITKYLVEMKTVSSDNIEAELNSNNNIQKDWEVAKANISADQTSVIIPDLKPAKKYIFRIKAVNRVGVGDPSYPTRNPIEVPVQPPSMPPENLTGTPRSSTSISVQWSPPPVDSQNGVIKGYKIRHKLAGYSSDTDWYTNDVSEVTHLNYVLDDLITWQNYDIQVAAENDKGVGPFSPSITVRTKEGKPDKGPRYVTAEAVKSTVIKVNWNPPPPEHLNGFNQGYKVQVWYDASLSQLAKESTVAHNSVTPLQTTTIDGLLPYTDYYVTVKCFTNAGDGVPNDELVRVKTKQDLPEAVPSLEFADVLDKTLKVVWRPPKRINGELTFYTLEYSETSDTDKKSVKKFPSTTTEARIVDLMPKTSYIFRLYPHTDVGQGPGRTNQTTTSVPPVLPEPPSNLTPIQVGSHSVTIKFEPGFDGNAGIEKWIAEALTPTHGDYKTRWQQIYTSTNHTQGSNLVTIYNLRPHTHYRIRLTPVNVVGSSRYPSEQSPEFQTTQVEPEQAPKDLSIEEIKSNSAVAHWSPLSNNLWLGNPRGYNLTWFESNNSTVMSYLINDSRADTFLVKDLEEFTEYTFRIYAVNDQGPSPPSEAVTITTLEDVPASGPTNVTAHALSSTTVSVDWNMVPKRHRNGIIRGYKIQYQASKSDALLQHKMIEDNSTKHVTLNDLKPYTLYNLAVAAYTQAGDGVYSPVVSVQTLEDTPGSPQNLSWPTVSQTAVRILWDPPEDPNGDILGYKVAYHALAENSKETASVELHQNERTFKATNLKPDTHYVFTVTAKTREGWGQQANTVIYTHDSELRANLPFYRESWFVILCACSSIVITIIVTALLFIQTKSYKYKQDTIKSTSQDRLGDAGFAIDDDPGNHYNNGFGLLTGSSNHRRSNGTLSQSNAAFTLPKTPPRPHPGSVVYSDDGDDDVFEDVLEKQPVKTVSGTSRYDDSSGDSLTEKPSEISSSPAPESESADDEYVNMANSNNNNNRNYMNHYANVNGTLRSQRSWKKGSTSSKQYASHRTKPKLPQRPAPSVPQVPSDLGHSSSDTASNQPMPGTSGMSQRSNGIYGESNGVSSKSQQLPLQQPPPMRSTMHHQNSNSSSSPPQVNGIDHNTNPKLADQQQQLQNTQQQQADNLLNNHIVSLNGGRIIVDNMAGSRAPLPGFTSFV